MGFSYRKCWPSAQKEARFSIRKDTQFDIPALKKMAETIPEGYELRRIDAEIYDQFPGSDYLRLYVLL